MDLLTSGYLLEGVDKLPAHGAGSWAKTKLSY